MAKSLKRKILDEVTCARTIGENESPTQAQRFQENLIKLEIADL
jgi:hypothetical protein